MDTAQTDKECLNCGRSVNQVPLVPVEHRNGSAYICPQCLPILIHQPGKLAAKLPGASELQGHQH
ncbi:MAG: hypothetical protein HDKAJFGB_00019 [Anaerolineae bacterium]|nr:hypothetical protein [Anaerolineae bacterium]MDL1897058.1 hypothetical protein [Anaerolineae bacterium CFX7]RIK34327.1 MAG: hypothetical protein DCC52_01015 [Chloroflexota bacterium]